MVIAKAFNRRKVARRSAAGNAVCLEKSSDFWSMYNTAIQEIGELIKLVDVVSFDLFDTLIFRTTGAPESVFRLLEHRWSLAGFAEMRIEAEHTARARAWQSNRHHEVSIESIYSQLPISPARQRRIMEDELELELQVVRGNRAMLDYVEISLALGKSVWICSDMYLPRAIITELARRCGIPKGVEILLSSETMLTKSAGSTFDRLLALAKIKPGQILHIGDNPASDFDVPRSKGIKAVLVPKVWGSNLSLLPTKMSSTEDLSARVIWDVIRQTGPSSRITKSRPNNGRDFWKDVGIELLTPAVVGFCQFIHRISRENKLERLFFLARDGAIVKEVYEALYPEAIAATYYLRVSRKVLNLAAIEGIDASAVEFFCSGATRLTVKDYFARIGVICDDNWEPAINSIGLSPDEVVASPAQFALLRSAFDKFQEPVLEICSRQRQILCEYLKSEGWEGGLRVGLVDIGWHGTLQRSLRLLWPRHIPEPAFCKGMYFGLFPEAAQKVVESSQAADGFLCHYGAPQFAHDTIMRCVSFHELLFSDTSAATLAIGKVDAEFRFEEASLDAERHRHLIIERIRSGLQLGLQGIGDVLPLLGATGDALRQVYLEAADQLLKHPTLEQAEKIGAVMHSEGFDHRVYKPLIIPPAASDRRSVRAARRKSEWKEGFDRLYRSKSRWS